MKTHTIALANILFAIISLAAPRGHGLEARLAARAARSHLTRPLAPVIRTSGQSNIQYSSNWAGGVLTSPPSGQRFTTVSAQFTVPVPSSPNGGSAAAAAWVGIDGDTYTNAILQTGVDFNVNSDGSVSYDAWYEWYPNYAIDFSGISISAGDNISVSVIAISSTRGAATVRNLSNGQSVSTTISAPSPSSSTSLSGQNAEWIVEDFDVNGSLVPFANFGSILFTNAIAQTSSSLLGTSGATVFEIVQNNQVLTLVSFPSSSQVQVTYNQ
ncbi:hypothetical protein Egran_04472 [Elaphomyces granulatus]|uniref:Aspergillopepsin-2 n=1 Tax=Elaphomyces granulatus TaxID=519963 RepID=A0A232LUD7_9EURO|nr:hypothetical protein Egran_04472 [Elaphomyces granulatus]